MCQIFINSHQSNHAFRATIRRYRSAKRCGEEKTEHTVSDGIPSYSVRTQFLPPIKPAFLLTFRRRSSLSTTHLLSTSNISELFIIIKLYYWPIACPFGDRFWTRIVNDNILSLVVRNIFVTSGSISSISESWSSGSRGSRPGTKLLSLPTDISCQRMIQAVRIALTYSFHYHSLIPKHPYHLRTLFQSLASPDKHNLEVLMQD